MTERRTQSVPEVQGLDPAISRVLIPMAQQLKVLTMRGTTKQIELLPEGATDEQMRLKINEIITHLLTT